MLGARHDGPRHLYPLILNRKGKPPSNLHCDDGIRSDTELAQYRFPHKWRVRPVDRLRQMGQRSYGAIGLSVSLLFRH